MSCELGMNVVPPHLGLPVQKFLTTNGDGTGSINATLNHSATPADYYYLVPGRYDIYSLLIAVSDDATFNQSDYGGIVSGLTNGIKMFVYNASMNAEIPLLSGVAIKKNFEWFQLTTNTGLTQFSGTPQTLRINFDIRQDYGMPICLSTGDKFIVRLNDNFTSLVGQTFGLRGIQH